MMPSRNSVALPEHMKRPGLRPAPVRDALSLAPACLHVLGYGCWALFCCFFQGDGSPFFVVPCFFLALLCPLLSFLWALVAVILGDRRNRNGAVLLFSLFLPLVYVLMMSAAA